MAQISSTDDNDENTTDQQSNVIKFPKVRNMLNSVSLVKDSDIDANPTVQQGRQAIQNLYQNAGMDPQTAQKEQMAGENLARQGGMIAGTSGDAGEVQELPGTGGIDSVMEAQNAAKQLAQTPGGAASQQIIGNEAARHLMLMKQMAAKNMPNWRNQ